MRFIAERMEQRVFASESGFEFAEFMVLCFLAFMVPFIIGHPQLLVGVLVNAFLVLSALNMGMKKVGVLASLPSLGALARGMLFGPFTFSLVFMLPFIWAGNLVLIWAIKEFVAGRRMNFLASIGIGAVAKAGLLFCSAYVLLQFGLLPALFLEAMGVLQLVTAVAGGILAFALWKAGIRLGFF